MNLFEFSKLAHIVVGAVVLFAFWGAVLAVKGSDRHRRYGRTYLLSMSLLLAITLVMIAGMLVTGQRMRAVFNVYVSLISVVTVWMAWASIRYRNDVESYRGRVGKLLCGALGAYGIFLASMAPTMGAPARIVMVAAFATLGLSIAAALLNRIIRGANHSRWWLSDHLTAMALNFAATHASFSILAGGAVFPALKEPWTRTTILIGWMVTALAVRVWAGQRFLKTAPANERPNSTSGSTIAQRSPSVRHIPVAGTDAAQRFLNQS